MYLLSMEKSTAGNAIYSIRLPSCNVIRWLITNILSIFQRSHLSLIPTVSFLIMKNTSVNTEWYFKKKIIKRPRRE